MPHFLSSALEGLVQSDIRRMTRECERVGGINLGQGICDLPTLERVAEAAKQAISEQKSTYSYPEGIPELRAAMARKLLRYNGIKACPTSEIPRPPRSRCCRNSFSHIWPPPRNSAAAR